VPPNRAQGTSAAKFALERLKKKSVAVFHVNDEYGVSLAAEFKKAKTVIVGVSPDGVPAHEKFKQKFRFPFELLSDPEQQVCKLFDVIKEKSMYGKKYLGVERSTFLLDEKGVLRQEWRKVKVDGHAAAVLAAARAL
jgi:peroxiredoxin Q/BCP